MTKRRKIVLDNSSRIMKAISLKSDRYVFEAITNEIIEEAINLVIECVKTVEDDNYGIINYNVLKLLLNEEIPKQLIITDVEGMPDPYWNEYVDGKQ